MVKRAKVLIAETNPLIRNAVESFLSNQGLDIIETHSGEEVVNTARASRPDIILLDSLLRGHGKRGVLRSLKEDSNLRKIPVILLGEDEGEIEEVFETIPEPLDEARLLESIERAIRLGLSQITPHEERIEGELGEKEFDLFREFLLEEVGLFFD